MQCDTLYRHDLLYKQNVASTDTSSGPGFRVARLSPAAVDEVRRRLSASNFDYGTAVRFRTEANGTRCTLKFDVAELGPDDCSDEWQGILFLYDKVDAQRIAGKEIDFVGGQFVVNA